MIKAEQEELQRIVEALTVEKYRNFFNSDLEKNIYFQKLKELAYKKRYPTAQPNTVTSLTWEQLLSMGDEARVYGYSDVVDVIQKEVERRLLSLLPNDKTE
jgi:hypothetical protein